VKIGQTAADMWRFSDFSRWRSPPSCIFEISKMPPDEILHTLWKLCIEIFVDSYQPSKKPYNISTLPVMFVVFLLIMGADALTTMAVNRS